MHRACDGWHASLVEYRNRTRHSERESGELRCIIQPRKLFDIDPSSNFANSINNREKRKRAGIPAGWAKYTSENIEKMSKFPFSQVGITRKTVQRSRGYPCTWWSVERSEPCSWCCSSTRRYSRGGRKCPRFHPTGPKFPSWNWSSSSYHASYSAGSWWVRNFSFAPCQNTPRRADTDTYVYLD